MALIVCTDCNKEISDSASACPNCGKPNKNHSSPLSLEAPISVKQKQPSRWRAIVLVIGFLLVILAYMRGQNSNSELIGTSIKNANTVTSKQASDIINIGNIKEILSAYEGNEVRADNLYKGKTIRVTGIVDSIKKDIMDDLYMTLGTGSQFEIPQLQAFFDDSQNSRLSELNNGARVTVVCRVSGLMMNVIANDCVIEK
ncbi:MULTISPECIES: zinc-ribbon domain-containing protein [Shewanella]|uniref:tRNA_anti-like n=1 Tax=Shewanella morhuae TaxID=365591 RepID=A0A380AZY6_9GAMM|nr:MULTISPECIES: zinc-ribbon domain-containing protein [Shewanella]SUI90881.1 tRNA_anti-like [Shewanella morhuae]